MDPALMAAVSTGAVRTAAAAVMAAVGREAVQEVGKGVLTGAMGLLEAWTAGERASAAAREVAIQADCQVAAD
jgi:hypothetical protein